MSDEIRNANAEAAGIAQDGPEATQGVNSQPQAETPQEATQGPQSRPGKPDKKQQAAKGTYTHTFANPVKYEDKEFKSLTFYWDRLTGEDMIAIENEMMAMNEYAITPEISARFLSLMAAKAAGVGPDMLTGLSVREFSKIRSEARNFLTATGY